MSLARFLMASASKAFTSFTTGASSVARSSSWRLTSSSLETSCTSSLAPPISFST